MITDWTVNQKFAAKAFSSWPWGQGKIADLDEQFPSYLSTWMDSGVLELPEGDTHFGYCEGDATVIEQTEGGVCRRLYHGMAFCVAGPAEVHSYAGPFNRGLVVSRKGFRGMPMVVGPLEREGRLKYIDGCTDSLLIPPVKLGDPCLNLLYFPPGIDQTRHTHPSERIGLILSGRGLCHAWDGGPDGEETVIPLVAGMLFTIHTDGVHKFSTPFGDEMRVLAYHPESDFGPTDEVHPMINRTIVDGVSASRIPEIRTK